MAPFARARERLDAMPGVARGRGDVVAEIGTDMTVFPRPGTWLVGGACPGNDRPVASADAASRPRATAGLARC